MAPSSKIRRPKRRLSVLSGSLIGMGAGRRRRSWQLLLVPLVLLFACRSPAWELDARVKWFGSVVALPEADLQRQQTGTPEYADDFDLRLMARHRQGPLQLIADHSTTLSRSDAVGFPGLAFRTLDQVPESDKRRVLDLTWELDEGKRHRLLHRLDRLAVRYNPGAWSITAGRDAVSWGNGQVFQTLDLFNPFAPTTVDRDYKTGDDMLLLERLFPGGGDLQVLAVGRRDQDGKVSRDAASLAGKWRVFAGEAEVEFVAARHYEDQVYGLALRWPVGNALVRSDLAATRLQAGTWKLSGLLNMDYSFVLGGRNVYVFGEYFHNSFGVRDLPDEVTDYPVTLSERLGRGELFNLMRDYLALGTRVEWHPLWNHTTTLIGNLQDGSLLLQTQLSFDPGDHQLIEVGVVHPIGGRGDEFGGVPVARDASGSLLTVGGGTSGYFRWVYYL